MMMVFISGFLFFQLQEENVSLEAEIREHSAKLRSAQDSLRLEGEMQTKLSSRYYHF